MARGTREPFCSCRLVRPVDRSCARSKAARGIVLDMDSSVSPTHGEQENSVWNGHYACTCYHPLFVFNQFGDLERCALRPGNVHSADAWDAVLKPVVTRYQGKVSRIYFRADAGFANPEVYEFLEAERIKYAIRLPANRVDRIGYLKRNLPRKSGPRYPSPHLSATKNETPNLPAETGPRTENFLLGFATQRQSRPSHMPRVRGHWASKP